PSRLSMHGYLQSHDFPRPRFEKRRLDERVKTSGESSHEDHIRHSTCLASVYIAEKKNIFASMHSALAHGSITGPQATDIVYIFLKPQYREARNNRELITNKIELAPRFLP